MLDNDCIQFNETSLLCHENYDFLDTITKRCDQWTFKVKPVEETSFFKSMKNIKSVQVSEKQAVFDSNQSIVPIIPDPSSPV